MDEYNKTTIFGCFKTAHIRLIQVHMAMLANMTA